MKATEYFAKYETRIAAEDDKTQTKAASALLLEMSDEAIALSKSRGGKDSTLISVLKETNQKWNSICKMFADKYGESPLLRNGFKAFWIDRVPQLAGRI